MVSERHSLLPTTEAKREVIAAIIESMNSGVLTKAELARRMRTSRSLVDRLLDPQQATSLSTLASAASAIGKHLRIAVVDAADRLSGRA
ncbi:MAG: XRE family transcriptional regulator [Planctomycetes bacterium]|nr:XRE family transcriptional regulator [Planctomycetota bacterium]